jgi:transcription antitermination factor NusG
MEKKWFVVYTKSRCEKKVAALLAKRNVENYCPLNRIMKQWADRKKLIYEPLFTSYVFIHACEKEIFSIKQITSDIVNFVYWIGKPATIKDDEIDNIKKFLNQHMDIQLEKQDVQISDQVRIISGPLMNVEGNVKAITNNKVKLSLPSLGYMMVAEVKISNVEVIQYPSTVLNMAHS